MLLSVNNILNNYNSFTFDLEKIGKEMMMVSVSEKNKSKVIPCYWRLKFENNCPPLEIGISPYSGDVINITCFITSDDFRHINLNFSVVSDKSIQVDTRIFSKANDFNEL